MGKYLRENIDWTLEAFDKTARCEWGFGGSDLVDALKELYERVLMGKEIAGVNKKIYLKHIKKAWKIAKKFDYDYYANMRHWWSVLHGMKGGATE